MDSVHEIEGETLMAINFNDTQTMGVLILPLNCCLLPPLCHSQIYHSNSWTLYILSITMWRRSRPAFHCTNCELEALQGKMEHQQQKITALGHSHAQLEQATKERENRQDKEIVIVLRKLNKHTKQIFQMGKDKHGPRDAALGLNAGIPSAGSQASYEVEQPQPPPPIASIQEYSQAIVDTEMKLHYPGSCIADYKLQTRFIFVKTLLFS
jgi:hypothetical protein